MNPAVPGAIPNWVGAPTYRLQDPTPDLFRAPLCSSSQANKSTSSGFRNEKRLYENTCRCAQGDDAVELAADGSIRGNCTGYVNIYSTTYIHTCPTVGQKIIQNSPLALKKNSGNEMRLNFSLNIFHKSFCTETIENVKKEYKKML